MDTYLPSNRFSGSSHAILHYSFQAKKTRKTKTRLEHIFIYFVFVLKFKTLILKLRSPRYLFSSFARQVLKTCGSLVETETPDDFKLFMEARR